MVAVGWSLLLLREGHPYRIFAQSLIETYRQDVRPLPGRGVVPEPKMGDDGDLNITPFLEGVGVRHPLPAP